MFGNSASRLTVCLAPAGFGKTFVCSKIIDTLLERVNAGKPWSVLYFFCGRSELPDSANIRSLFTSLLKQTLDSNLHRHELVDMAEAVLKPSRGLGVLDKTSGAEITTDRICLALQGVLSQLSRTR